MVESYNIRARIMIVEAVKMLTQGIVFVLLYSSIANIKKVYYTNKRNNKLFCAYNLNSQN